MLSLIRLVCIIESKTNFLAQIQQKLLYLNSKMVTFSNSDSRALFLTYYIWFEQFLK